MKNPQEVFDREIRDQVVKLLLALKKHPKNIPRDIQVEQMLVAIERQIGMDEAFRFMLRNKQYRYAEMYLDRGANIDAEEGQALREAIGSQSVKTIDWLLRHRADFNLVNSMEVVVPVIGLRDLNLLKAIIGKSRPTDAQLGVYLDRAVELDDMPIIQYLVEELRADPFRGDYAPMDTARQRHNRRVVAYFESRRR